MNLWLRLLLGIVTILGLQALSGIKHYYLAGLAPLFPTFSLIAHATVGAERTVEELQATLRFSMLSILPYIAYLIALYVLAPKVKLAWALIGAVACWTVVALGIVILWQRL